MNSLPSWRTPSTADRRIEQPVRQGSVQGPKNKTHSSPRASARQEGSSVEVTYEGDLHVTDTDTNTPVAQSGPASSTISLAVPPLQSSRSWTYSSAEQFNGTGSLSLQDASDRAKSLNDRLSRPSDYLDSADSIREELYTSKTLLHSALSKTKVLDVHLRTEVIYSLSSILERLGDYDEAATLLRLLSPPLPLNRSDFMALNEWHQVQGILIYLQFLISTGRDLGEAEATARLLQWLDEGRFTEQIDKSPILLKLIQTLNYQGCHKEASKWLGMCCVLYPSMAFSDLEYLFQKAMAAAGEGMQIEAQALFVESLTLASLSQGRWHLRTLNILYFFGRAAKAWSKHDSARKLLTNCCQGLFYVLGASHPLSIRAYEEFKIYGTDDGSTRSLRWLGHSQYSLRKKWGTAYMHNYLITPIEFLQNSIEVDYQRVVGRLELLLDRQDLSSRTMFDVRRSLAWCEFGQKEIDKARKTLSSLHSCVQDVSNKRIDANAFRAILQSDEAIFAASCPDASEEASRLSKSVYLGLSAVPKQRRHQGKAVLERLIKYDLAHFAHSMVFSNPPLLTESHLESLGSGSSATVDTVWMGDKLYARKSISLPHQRQDRHREEIRKEIRAIHTLRHPHIVRVLFTYEEARRICIVIHPLAECDLETFLANNQCRFNDQISLCNKWTLCLVNTLTFIHSKGIRHKDIKPRNILVKGVKVYLADFGSCHVFSDSGNSTTEGIAHGHTRAYCAPEVIRHTERNRSSDVFSLGCVLSEIVVWSSGIPISSYFEFLTGNKEGDQHQYHDSTKQVKGWFRTWGIGFPRTQALFTEVIRHMLHKKPEKRWTAVQVSRALRKRGPVNCEKCDLDLWVEDSA